MSRHVCRAPSDLAVRLLADLVAVDLVLARAEGRLEGLTLRELSDLVERRLTAELRPPKVKRSASTPPALPEGAPR